jgi:hypothetical protein
MSARLTADAVVCFHGMCRDVILVKAEGSEHGNTIWLDYCVCRLLCSVFIGLGLWNQE